MGGRIAAGTDYSSRGYSVTDGDPAVTGAVSYDHQSGIYANGLVVLARDDSFVGVSGFEANIGYAARISRSASVETGVVRTEYARRPGQPLSRRYTEIYAGIAVRGFAARAYYSPDYFTKDRATLYVELQGNVALRPKWNLGLHVGALTYLKDPPPYTARSRYDWRATVSRELGAFEVYAGLSGRGPGGDYYARNKGRAVASFGAAVSF